VVDAAGLMELKEGPAEFAWKILSLQKFPSKFRHASVAVAGF